MIFDRVAGDVLALSFLILFGPPSRGAACVHFLRGNPRLRRLAIEMRRTLSKSGAPERALKSFVEIHRQYGDPMALYPIAVMLERLGRPAEAAIAYQRYLDSGVEADPDRLAKIRAQLRLALALVQPPLRLRRYPAEKLRPVAPPPTMASVQALSPRRDYVYFDVGI